MDFTTFYTGYQKKRKTFPLPADIKERVEDCLSVTVHTTGARPSFKTQGGKLVTYKSYNKKYDALFSERILNRHPNENEEHHNWRMSVYEPVAKELYDRFLTMCRGTILQPNNYQLITDDKTEKYIKQSYMYDTLYEGIPYVLENPYGLMAVIESDVHEKDETTELKPKIIFVKVEDIIMLDDESCAFKYQNRVYYINDTLQTVIDKNKTYETVHNFGKCPYWQTTNNFMEPFVSWANLTVRNMNDDEAMTKHYSYPIKQLVLPKCKAKGCVDGIIVDSTDKLHPKRTKCGECKGLGTMTTNPGDVYSIPESLVYKNGGTMHDMAKFITPDSSIPKYHLERWLVFYDKTEKSLCLNKKINATESGDAKREDRKDQYFYLMAISNFLFENIKKGLYFMSAYLNYNQSTKTFEGQEIILVPPKQFELMTDSDLIAEFADIQNKTDDIMLLSEMQYVINRRIWRTDKVQLKISEILYYHDPLYGLAGNALKSKLLSGSYTDVDKLMHDKGPKILLILSNEMGAVDFVNATMTTLLEKLNSKIAELVPKTIYNVG